MQSVRGREGGKGLPGVWCAAHCASCAPQHARSLKLCAPLRPTLHSTDAVDAYKPVCAQPNDYDADGSVLHSMADSLLRFWHHCYGPDGQGGAVAAVTAAAQQALHQLAAVPLPASQGGSTLWCEGLFKGREEVSSAFSVANFLRSQQVGCEWRMDGLGLYGCAVAPFPLKAVLQGGIA